MSGIVLLPTKGRPLSLKRFITRYHLTACVTPVLLIFDESDIKSGIYDNIGWHPACFKVMVVPEGTRIVKAFNEAFLQNPDKDFYGIMADDVVAETDEWDKKLANACANDKLSYGDEGIDRTETHNTKHFPTHPFIGGDLVRKWGFIAPPVLNHFYADNWWYDAAEQAPMPDVKMTHYHFKNGKAEKDDTYKNRPNSEIDKENYLAFCMQNKHHLCNNRITLHRETIYLDANRET